MGSRVLRTAGVLLATILTGAALIPAGVAGQRSGGHWSVAQSQPILDKTLTVRLAPDLRVLAPAERAAVEKLLAAGSILQHVYEDMNHRDALGAHQELVALNRRTDTAETRNLLQLERLFEGPIATTLDNQRLPILATDSLVPGKNLYPWGVTKDEIERFLAKHPERRAAILDPRTIVRRAEAASLRADLAALERHPALDLLHPGLRARLAAMARQPSHDAFYAVPYPVAYADSMIAIYRLIDDAAALVDTTDKDLAGYLRLRARDLLTNDYEGGDAAWVKGRFGAINAQIGAYEVYDDELYGVKASFALSVMLTDAKRTADVRGAIKGLQAFEDSLPYTPHKKVIEDIPVGVYDVIADFGQSRGTNTASILPNDSEHARRYGRTILLRRNIMSDPGIVEGSRRAFEAALDPAFHGDFDPDGSFYRTLWHELGHYLGPDRDAKGRELDLALEEESGTFEEMKADLVSLFVAPQLEKRGYYSAPQLRALYASGVLRMLNKTQPRPDQVYGTMQLMQLNWFLDRGALTYGASTHRLSIHYDKYSAAVASLLERVLAIQSDGDLEQANAFIAKWTTWDERHEALAKAMKATETSRFRLVRFAALGE